MPDMRFAPPNPLRIADRSSGMNSVSVRSFNERLMLYQQARSARREAGGARLSQRLVQQQVLLTAVVRTLGVTRQVLGHNLPLMAHISGAPVTTALFFLWRGRCEQRSSHGGCVCERERAGERERERGSARSHRGGPVCV